MVQTQSNHSKQKPVKAMILAAGRGKRLRPITDHIPKPLVEVCQKPLIEYHLEKLAQIGVQEVVINHAWLGHKLEEQLGDGRRWQLKIHYSPEPEGGLETAGGIIKALPLLGNAPFIVINGDVFCDFDFGDLTAKAQEMAEQPGDIQGFLYLVPSPEHNPKGDFGLNEHGEVEAEGPFTFAGLSILKPELFTGMDVDFIPLAPILREAMLKGQIAGKIQDGFWSDVGTIERLENTEQQWLNKAI